MDGFTITKLNKLFEVEGIITIHYFEFGKNYLFSGEEHDFWELVYIDKGTADIYADGEWKSVDQGNIVFHRPMQFHNIRANGITAPNTAIVTFVCKSEHMKFFDNKRISLSKEEQDLMSRIISLAKETFYTPLDDIFTKGLDKVGDVASEQLLGLYLEGLLLSIYRRSNEIKHTRSEPKNIGSDASMAIAYMEKNIGKSLCIADIARNIMKSESELKRVFKSETGIGVMTYFRSMKINYAKQMLRQGELNITEIAEQLGYDSIHHFSKQFKSITGMSPREYAKSIKSRLDGQVKI